MSGFFSVTRPPPTCGGQAKDGRYKAETKLQRQVAATRSGSGGRILGEGLSQHAGDIVGGGFAIFVFILMLLDPAIAAGKRFRAFVCIGQTVRMQTGAMRGMANGGIDGDGFGNPGEQLWWDGICRPSCPSRRAFRATSSVCLATGTGGMSPLCAKKAVKPRTRMVLVQNMRLLWQRAHAARRLAKWSKTPLW
jgi:hypothetical protein